MVKGLHPSPPTMTRQRREMDKRPATGDWQNCTNKLLDEAKNHKQASQQLRDQNVALKRSGDKEVQDQQNLVNEELRRRIALLADLKKRLERQLSLTTTELTNLIQARAKTKEKLDEHRKPLKVAEARVKQRSGRPSTEQINDTVDRALRQETIELRTSLEQLGEMVRTSAEIIAKLDRSKQQLEADLADKTQALMLDRSCLEVRVQDAPPGLADSADITCALGPKRSAQNPDKWKKNTLQLLNEAADLEAKSVRLRKIIAKTILTLTETNAQAATAVNDALRNKVKQTQQLHSQLSANLQAVNSELEELANHRQQISQTLKAKEGPLSVICQRLEIRKQRPDREAIRDNVEEALESELKKLKSTMDALRDKLRLIDEETARLSALKSQLERDLANKTSALQHDRGALAIDLSAVKSSCGSLSSRSAKSVPSLPSISSGRSYPYSAR